MSTIPYDEISYPEIVTFLSVAQTLSMSLTAQAMHISQPAVSKRISNLERKFQIILFTRTEGGLQITPAGKALYQELTISVSHLKTGLTKAREVQAAPVRTLKLCYDLFFDPLLLYQIIREFSDRNPMVQVECKRYFDEEAEDCLMLFTQKADLMICPDSFGYHYEPHINKLPLGAFQFSILVARDHPLAGKDLLTPVDLIGVPLTVAHNHSGSPYVNALHAIFTPYGVVPQIDHVTSRYDLCFDIVTRSGVAIAAPEFWRLFHNRSAMFFEEHIRVYPIEGAYYPVSLIWRKNPTDPLVEDFVKVFSKVISQPENAEIIRRCYHR